MDDSHDPAGTLRAAGLPIEDFPGLIVPFVFSEIALESVAAHVSLASRLAVPAELLHLGVVIFSALLAFIAYTTGNFWDDRVFDPRYGLRDQLAAALAGEGSLAMIGGAAVIGTAAPDRGRDVPDG